MPFANAVGPKARAALNAPLVNVTGYEPVDALLTSPVSLALMAGGGIAKVAKVAVPLVRAVAAGEVSAKVAADMVGLALGYRGEKGLRVVQGLREALAGVAEKPPGAPEAPPRPANATGTGWAPGQMPTPPTATVAAQPVSAPMAPGSAPRPAAGGPLTMVPEPRVVSPVTGPVSEARAQELLQKFGGRAGATPPETVSAASAPVTGPPLESVPATAPKNSYPDQKALNQEAIAKRRAEYQARQAAPDAKLYTELRTQNLTDAEARKVMEAKAAMDKISALGGTQTDAEMIAEIKARRNNRSPKR